MVNCEQKRRTYLRKTGNRSPAVANATNPLAKTAFRDNAITTTAFECVKKIQSLHATSKRSHRFFSVII
jgi:hypothetical protein